MRIIMIAAVDEKLGIGKNGLIPWNICGDRALFRQITMGFPLLVGRKTFESWGGHPLEGRPCAVWTHHPELYENKVFEEDFCSGSDLNGLIQWCMDRSETLFVCGGEMLYRAMSERSAVLMISRIHGDYACDAFFPDCFERFELKTRVKYEWGDWELFEKLGTMRHEV